MTRRTPTPAPDAPAGLAAFTEATRSWFTESFAEPTPAQAGAWRAITSGQHALVVAPTGSGKTLAAFLAALDRLSRRPADAPRAGVHTLYVSPLKALAVDVERNLRAPLRGIARTAERLGGTPPEISVAVRSGDTPASDRRRLVTHPPDVLITTPESLFLMMTSQAREILTEVDTVILDEVHALAGSKRGAHLAITLERLEQWVLDHDHPAFQRIGLSATVRPPERVAAYLGGSHPVQVVDPPAVKQWELTVAVPIEDMSALGSTRQIDPDDPLAVPERPSIWPHVERRILDVITAHRSTIVFANSRRLAERLTSHLNELHAADLGIELEQHPAQPAEVMAQSGASQGAPPVIARAHHGSVSKEQRADIEGALKSGQLPCVVATSSLELGIDMGAVDVVVQVESPPSVASGLQRVGRAGHQVGAVSRGVFFPNHRGDLVESAVVVERMRAGAIEEVADLRNPLDVLAQQVVAIAAADDVDVDALYALVRRASSFTELPRSAFDATLDMLSGRYPSEDFAELRPRVVWNRDTGQLSARPGAQRLAVTSGGTIPDRGLFGVFLVGAESGPGRRVGELDEEMVYETRVGDVFTLGTTSWRVEQITHDQVQVSPAPGVPGKLPFWKGDAPGRPAELGRALGAFTREISSLPPDEARSRLAGSGLDEWAADNLVSYLAEQRSATTVLPSDTTIVVERFRDELGDWRVCIHSPLGSSVLAPWALVIEQRARERYGTEVSATATNDGIVLRVPDTDADPPGVELLSVDVEELIRIVTDEVTSSALFASRFRECAARALLLPRRDPRSRSPLWQQRMRSAQLLQVASRFPDFPIVLETIRECLNDVYDLPGLRALHEGIQARRIQLVEVETKEASPFATSLLFGYIGSFVYEGDVPLAERRAAALSLDAGLLSELLGTEGLATLLDEAVIAEVEAGLQALLEERRATSVEQLFDLVRTAGPFSTEELGVRSAEVDVDRAVEQLQQARRIAEVRIAGERRWAVTEDLTRLQDALGVPVPPGYAAPPADSDADPVHDLVLRYARTHGPFSARTAADRFGLGVAVVGSATRALVRDGSLASGAFTGPGVEEYCHSRVLALIKRRTLARLRREVEPVDQPTYTRFLTDWQGVSPGQRARTRGVDGTLAAIESLAGYPVPASMLEAVVLPSRVADYQPRHLDELLSAGEVSWAGTARIGTSGDGSGDGWVALWPSELDLAPAPGEPSSQQARELLERLASGGAWRFEDLVADTRDRDGGSELSTRRETAVALWELVWAGLVTSDSFSALRAASTGGALKRPRAPTARRPSRLQASRPRRPGGGSSLEGATTAGRWSVVPGPGGGEAAVRRRFSTDLLLMLDRYGVLTRGSVLTERPEGGFGPVYRGLSQLEEAGQCRRGYFVDGLGAAQFALAGAVDRLRSHGEDESGTPRQQGPDEDEVVVLAACDPANPFGAALPWPERAGHRPGRKPGALVLVRRGRLVLYVERGGRSLLTFTADADDLGAAALALAGATARGWLGRVTIERVDSEHVFESRAKDALEAAGFAMTPQGMRVRARALADADRSG
ncbi:ATP-dependent helicase [Auraticoccus monumenti]|uniref:ATP dependent helicase, Lhr family n=1 Tax=Auraticoccus monumenti TaxID=675864 RepID=A0A1G7CM99_9ACTN|nr:ATP-dependent helicase [Auraticoccus monumenti]SDE40468.1 ATP dependent helicase, Lhr family [Auraticoccus monumenti]